MWLTVESCFLASVAMFEIVFNVAAVPRAENSFFQMLTIYMVLGIGADDAFIVYDAWLQARFAGEEVNKDWQRLGLPPRLQRHGGHHGHDLRLLRDRSRQPVAAGPRLFCIFAAFVVFADWLFCHGVRVSPSRTRSCDLD